MHAKRAARSVLDTADRALPVAPGIVILIYHRVGGGTTSAVDLDPGAFAEQLDLLRDRHRVLTLDEAVDAVLAARPQRGVVVTIDDGTADVVEVAVPLLVERNLPATVYVATRFVDEGAPFPWGAPPASWAGLRDASATGLVQIESHSHGHRLLDRVPPAEVRDDLDRSIGLIEEHIGRRPRHFAYPKAVPGSFAAEAAVGARFASAALAGSRVNVPSRAEALRLGRTPVQRDDDLDRFARKAAGGLRLEGLARDLAARWRYRGQET